MAGVLAVVVLAACGGDDSNGFDEAGLRDLIEANALPGTSDEDVDSIVDYVRETCDATEAEQRIRATASDNSAGPSMVEMMEVACPDDVKID